MQVDFRPQQSLKKFSRILPDDQPVEIDEAPSKSEMEFPDHAAVVSQKFHFGQTNKESGEIRGVRSQPFSDIGHSPAIGLKPNLRKNMQTNEINSVNKVCLK